MNKSFEHFEKIHDRDNAAQPQEEFSSAQQREILQWLEEIITKGEPVTLALMKHEISSLHGSPDHRIPKLLRRLIYREFREPDRLYFLKWTSGEEVSQFMLKRRAYHKLSEDRKITMAARWRAILRDQQQAAVDRHDGPSE